MAQPLRRNLLVALISSQIASLSGAVLAADDAQTTTSLPSPSPTARGPQSVDKIVVTGQKLDDARSGLSPDTGSTIFRFDKKDLLALPLGDSTPLNQVILRSPGAVQDSFGQLHIRGDHGNLQYRVNGVVIPEAISGFGQALDTHFADQINILTGALPAQYGYRTAGIIDIQTKGSGFENAGRVAFLGGSHQHQESSAEIGGSQGSFTYYLNGTYLRNQLGIENPTPNKNAIHDQTTQAKRFGYLSWLPTEDSRVSLLFGTSNSKFQIPNVPGLQPTFSLASAPAMTSETLDARQNEKNSFQILSYQGVIGASVDFQASVFHRYTDVNYLPDPIGDLMFNGVAAKVLRRNEAAGFQGDLSYRLNPQHTLRTGVFVQRERFGSDNSAQVFPADDAGNQTSTNPITIVDNSRIAGKLYGVYLQDEWKPTKALTVNYGARFDKVNTIVSESQLSPRLGMTVTLTDKTTVHAGYARYFTPPPTEKIDTTSINKFLNTTNALPSDANTSVKSERSNYFDAGISHQLTPQITLGLDAYYRSVRHLQDEGQFGNALIFSAFNFEKGRVRGVELSTAFREKNFAAYANLTLSKAEARNIESGQFNFDDGELEYINRNWVHLDHDQTAAISTGASYKLGTTQLSADVLYGSGLRRGFANAEHLPGYTQTNVAVTHEFNATGFAKFECRLSIINLFDKSYQLRDGTGIGVGAPQFAARRTIYAGISAGF